jgi:hypothetical protein
MTKEAGARTIHHTQLADLPPDDPLFREWQTYRRELPRLLAEGSEGKFLLIKGDQVIAVCDTWGAARDEGLSRYLLEPFFIHQVRSEEPILAGPRYR